MVSRDATATGAMPAALDGHRAIESNMPTQSRGHGTAADSPSRLTKLRWVILAFVPSSLLVGITNAITTDIAPIPLLWVIPLSLYLLTFIIAFAPRVRLPLGLLGKVLAISAV